MGPLTSPPRAGSLLRQPSKLVLLRNLRRQFGCDTPQSSSPYGSQRSSERAASDHHSRPPGIRDHRVIRLRLRWTVPLSLPSSPRGRPTSGNTLHRWLTRRRTMDRIPLSVDREPPVRARPLPTRDHSFTAPGELPRHTHRRNRRLDVRGSSMSADVAHVRADTTSDDD
jgi:hypothetical protein